MKQMNRMTHTQMTCVKNAERRSNSMCDIKCGENK